MNTSILFLTLQTLVLCLAGKTVRGKTEKDCECVDPPSMLLFGIAMGIAYLIINQKKVFQHPSGQRYGLGGFHTGEDYYSDDEEDEYSDESEEEEDYEGAEEEEAEGEEVDEEEEEAEGEEDETSTRTSARLRRRNV